MSSDRKTTAGEQSQNGSSQTDRGWNIPQPETLPKPTYWPAVLALGTTFMLFGLVTTLIISGVGLALFVVALAGWIGEIRDEH